MKEVEGFLDVSAIFLNLDEVLRTNQTEEPILIEDRIEENELENALKC